MRILIMIFILSICMSPAALHAESDLQISRAVFCTSLDDREPGETPETIKAGQQTVYFYTEIINGKGQAVDHRWFYNDFQIADVALYVGADRWRTWSNKQVWHLTPGTLKVQVYDLDEKLLVEKEIQIQ